MNCEAQHQVTIISPHRKYQPVAPPCLQDIWCSCNQWVAHFPSFSVSLYWVQMCKSTSIILLYISFESFARIMSSMKQNTWSPSGICSLRSEWWNDRKCELNKTFVQWVITDGLEVKPYELPCTERNRSLFLYRGNANPYLAPWCCRMPWRHRPLKLFFHQLQPS